MKRWWLILVLLAAMAPGSASAQLAEGTAVPSLLQQPKKPGEIILRGEGPRIFGPFRFRPGGYVWRFQQLNDPVFGFNGTSFVVSLESKAGDVTQPYQLLSNTSARRGRNQVVVEGRLFVDVSSSANPFVMRFTPK